MSVDSPPPTAVVDSSSRAFLAAIVRGQGAYEGRWLGAGSLAIDAGLARGLGAILDAGIESSRLDSTADGSVTSWLSWAGLMVRYALRIDEWALSASLGARVYRTAATATGFTSSDGEQVRYAPAAVAALECRRTLWRGLFVSAALTGYLRQPQEFTIRGVAQPVGLLSAGGASLALGAGWSFL